MRHHLPDFVVAVAVVHQNDEVGQVVAVNNMGTKGRWAFAELTQVYQIESEFEARVEAEFDGMLERAVGEGVLAGAEA